MGMGKFCIVVHFVLLFLATHNGIIASVRKKRVESERKHTRHMSHILEM